MHEVTYTVIESFEELLEVLESDGDALMLNVVGTTISFGGRNGSKYQLSKELQRDSINMKGLYHKIVMHCAEKANINLRFRD